jgi:hypothetical protein
MLLDEYYNQTNPIPEGMSKSDAAKAAIQKISALSRSVREYALGGGDAKFYEFGSKADRREALLSLAKDDEKDAANFIIDATFAGMGGSLISMASGKFLANDGSKDVNDTASRLIVEQAVSELVASWAESSNNSHALSLLIQNEAEKMLNLSDAFQWDFADERSKKALDKINQNEEAMEFVREFVAAQYALTQKRLKQLNVPSVTIWRGQTSSSKDLLSTRGPELLSMRPLSSWSLDYGIAEGFSHHEVDGRYYAKEGSSNLTIRSEVPASRIFGMSGSGFGCLSEQEVVVLGGSMRYDYLESTSRVNEGETMADILTRYELIDDLRKYLEGSGRGLFNDATPGEFYTNITSGLYDIFVSAGRDAMLDAIRRLLAEDALPDDLVDLAEKALKEYKPGGGDIETVGDALSDLYRYLNNKKDQ